VHEIQSRSISNKKRVGLKRLTRRCLSWAGRVSNPEPTENAPLPVTGLSTKSIGCLTPIRENLSTTHHKAQPIPAKFMQSSSTDFPSRGVPHAPPRDSGECLTLRSDKSRRIETLLDRPAGPARPNGVRPCFNSGERWTEFSLPPVGTQYDLRIHHGSGAQRRLKPPHHKPQWG
jgi:hypothetical protein